jgi:gas vesicle protein
MHKGNVSGSLFAFMAGMTAGAGVGLLLTPHSGAEVRSYLRKYMRKITDEAGEQTEDRSTPGTTQTGAHGESIRMPGAECSMRSAPQDHAMGDTGHDN